jgi:hypothetical protein
MFFFPTYWLLGRAGQSVRIGWAKLLGTFAATVVETTLYQTNHPFVLVMAWGCLVFDLGYVFIF